VSSIYESGEYLRRNPGWHVEESPWKAVQVIRMLDRGDLHPKTVCEIGCGAGRVLSELQESLGPTCELWGYDISPQAMELCRANANDRLHFELADAESVPDGRFDLVLVLDVIEHLEDSFGFLRTIRSKGRHTILHIPLDLSVSTIARQGALLDVRDAYGHIQYFTKETALRMLRETGHRVIDSFYTARAIEQPSSGLRRRLLKWPRRALFAIDQDLAGRLLGGWSLLVLTAAAGVSGP
jgi:2-polyprenyl-3-methyl-5-hydroxy-6-metoxy-1,4-benzoquinol methylase